MDRSQSYTMNHRWYGQTITEINGRKKKRKKRSLFRRINWRFLLMQTLVTTLVCAFLGPLKIDHYLPMPDIDNDGRLMWTPLRKDWKIPRKRNSIQDELTTPPEQNKEGEDKNSRTALATASQLRQCDSAESENRLISALEYLQNEAFRRRVDPLNENNFIQGRSSNRISFAPKSKYLGVLVDAGRHYYPIPWLKRLIHYLYRLRFNLIHFRLTDDQAFSLQLESHPQLSLASAVANTTYTPSELRELVMYAKQYNIFIIPEVNVPGHAGAWSGIPEMILPCSKFACRLGYGIPMNVEYEHLMPILKEVIKEVLDIFDDPPFLHLGGDEIHKSAECFAELGLQPFQYDVFESQLKDILAEIGYPEDRVIRWEITGPETSTPRERAGNIQHNWYNLPGQKLAIHPDHTYFNSWRLYMDSNDNDGAVQIYHNTVQNFQLHLQGTRHIPDAIIPAAFELDTDLWLQRNVAARLIAVAMGAAHLKLNNTAEILQVYGQACDEIGLHPKICDLQGFTAVPNQQYKKDWQARWDQWIKGACDRFNAIV